MAGVSTRKRIPHVKQVSSSISPAMAVADTKLVHLDPNQDYWIERVDVNLNDNTAAALLDLLTATAAVANAAGTSLFQINLQTATKNANLTSEGSSPNLGLSLAERKIPAGTRLYWRVSGAAIGADAAVSCNVVLVPVPPGGVTS